MTIAVDLGRKATKQTNKQITLKAPAKVHLKCCLMYTFANIILTYVSIGANSVNPDHTALKGAV